MTSTDESIRQKIISALNQWHQTNPLLETGLDSKGLAGKLGYESPVGKLYLGTVLDSLQQEGKIRQSGSTWLLSDFNVAIDSRTKEALSWLESTIEQYGVLKTVATEMESLVQAAQARGISKQKLMMMLMYLAKEGTLYFYDDDYIHRSVVDKCRNMLLSDLLQKEAGINEKEFRLLIDGTKRIVQVLIRIFIEEGSITKQSFYLRITEKGKKM
jgi:hypothetical protein